MAMTTMAEILNMRSLVMISSEILQGIQAQRPDAPYGVELWVITVQ